MAPNMPGGAWSQGGREVGGGQRPEILLRRLGPTLKPPGSPRRSEARVAQSCLCGHHTLATLRGRGVKGWGPRAALRC